MREGDDGILVDDECLSLHGVFAHVVFEELLHLVLLSECHLLKSYIRTDESSELVWRYLAKSFEACYLWVWPELL